MSLASTAPAGPTALSRALLVVGGPALVGACLGLPDGALAVLHRASALPAIVLGVAVLMMPALYIGTALAGVAPGLRDVGRAWLVGLSAAGAVLLGLAPALAFLVATSTGAATVALLGHLVVALAMLLALGALRHRLLGDAIPLHARALFAAWALVALGLGERLLAATFS